MNENLNTLKRLFQEALDLNRINAVLSWDQLTQMPPGGVEARGRHLALLSRLFFERMSDPEIGRLLDQLEPQAENMDPDSDDAALIRAARREYDRMVKIPPQFAAEQAEHYANSYQTWTQARPANDWKRVEPDLERNLELSRRLANFFPGYDHIADPLIDFADYGMKAADVRRIFADLRQELVPLIVQHIAEPVPGG